MKQPRHALKYTLAVLLLAALTTTEILSATYAKYITSAATPTETARVAKYDVQIVPVEDNDQDPDKVGDVNLDAADGTLNKSASVVQYYKVINSSEVAVSYKVVVTLSKSLPTGTTIDLADDVKQNITLAESVTDENAPIKVEKTVRTDSEEISFTCSSAAWTLAPGAGDGGLHTIALTFTTQNSTDAVSDINGIGVTVEVIATQID